MDSILAYYARKGMAVLEDAEAAKADIVVCSPAGPTPFADTVQAPCADCGTLLMHRPKAPAAPKVCAPCAGRRMEAMAAKGRDVSCVTSRSAAAEVMLLRAKSEGNG